MILTDAGPLIAILDRDDQDHKSCVAALSRLHGIMVTSSAAFTEAIYLLGARTGWAGQEALFTLVERGDLLTLDLSVSDMAQCRALMKQYRNVPMDFADATLVVLAGRIRTLRVFTLDSDFRTYRSLTKRAFTIIPKL